MLIVGDAHHIAVLVFESRAGDDDAIGGAEVAHCFGAEEDQPVPAVAVGEGLTECHLVFVGFGVEL